ncbi:hypothetical protein [Clostridium sp. B9]|uniref:hypothetical protein n=1 Tax=Clostridium sp. B9 TaxID=3423224 RepID=UPI003D2EA74A
MKRLPEFILGLIGSILTFFTAIGTDRLLSKLPYNIGGELIYNAYKLSPYGIWIAIIALCCSILIAINKYTKIVSILLIILSIILILTNFFQMIAFILILIAGIMGLARKVEK